MATSISQWKDLLTGNTQNNIVYENKGFYPRTHNTVTLDEQTHNNIFKPYVQSNIQKLEELIKICQNYNAEVSIVVTPLADAYLYANDGWDQFHEFMIEFCENQNIAFYDFNLLKDRYLLLSDEYSFLDTGHMSQQGATAFTHSLAYVIKKVSNGESIDHLFYSSYQEMLLDSPYAQ